MTQLPDGRPTYVGQPQPMPGWPTEPTVAPAAVELYGERRAVVYVPDAYGQMVPMFKDTLPAPLQPTPPRDLAPQPLFDPGAQKIAAGGVLAAGAGWGGGQFLAGASQFVSVLTGAGTMVAWMVGAFVVARITTALAGGHGAGRQGDTYNITNNNRWWGSSSTRT